MKKEASDFWYMILIASFVEMLLGYPTLNFKDITTKQHSCNIQPECNCIHKTKLNGTTYSKKHYKSFY